MESEVRNRKSAPKSKSTAMRTEVEELRKEVSNERLQRKSSEKPSTERSEEDVLEPTRTSSAWSPPAITVHLDLVSVMLFGLAFATRVFRLSIPFNVVFDELHYGKYVSLYMKNTFFFDQHPPLGKQLIAGAAYFTGYDGNYTFSKIGAAYADTVPVATLRFIPALCGSLLAPVVYRILLQMRVSFGIACLGGGMIILDNALLTQSRFILMEPILLLFTALGLLFLLKFLASRSFYPSWWFFGSLSALFFAAALSVKYVGFYACLLAFILNVRHLWRLLSDRSVSDCHLVANTFAKILIFVTITTGVYLGTFYVHLAVLHKAGPHDSVMTSAFQASLEGGLASITKGQPLNVVHGSQITLRHTHGRTCWLHSHPHVYPVRYPDNRGSSHQQQVTCYSFKDVHNWWIVKRPEVAELVVGDTPDPIRDGDEIQLVHGITSRALNSHDVAAAMSPHCQEVSCYIDYNISMPAQMLWRVDVINRHEDGEIWHAITSQVRLIHTSSGLALRFSGKQLPDWGFNQHEVVADRVVNQPDTVWNVEEHRYTLAADQKERELQMIKAEMIPTQPTVLTFWSKFLELQSKMLWYSDKLTSHMYSSEPLEWPLMSKGIAYWVARDSNAQIHLLGNIVIWYSGTASILTYATLLVFYLLRRHRKCFDIPEPEWERFKSAGEVFLVGYLIHYLPYFFIERTLFLHNYLPALLFKILLLCFVLDHVHTLLTSRRALKLAYRASLVAWTLAVVFVYHRFSALSYGFPKLSAQDVIQLRWRDSWDFILHKEIS